MNKLIILSVFIFFIWVSAQQHISISKVTPEQIEDIRMETRARAIMSGGYVGE